MFRIFIFLVSVAIFFCFFGCSGSNPAVSVSNQQPDENSTSAGEFTDATEAFNEGSDLLDAGETDKAIDALNKAVKLNPDHAEAYFKLGIAYALVEKRDAALVATQVAQTPLPGENTPKAVKTDSEKAFENAVEAYKKVVASNREDDVAHFNLGRAYNKLNEDEEAAKALRQAVKLRPDDTEFQTELGAILIKLARYREAVDPLKKALELDPENSKAQEMLEDAEAGRKRIDFTTAKKDDNKNVNTNANSNSQPADTNTKAISTNTKEVRLKGLPVKPN